MVLFRRKKASDDQTDEVEGEIKEKKKWLHRPASRCWDSADGSIWLLTAVLYDLQIPHSSMSRCYRIVHFDAPADTRLQTTAPQGMAAHIDAQDGELD